MIPALVQKLLKIFVGGPKRPPGWNRVKRATSVFKVCSKLKPGVSVVLIDCEHIFFGDLFLWKVLHDFHQVLFDKSLVCNDQTLPILPILKGKGAKANNKDYYLGITLFLTFCKIYEMIILNRLGKFASQAEYFSEFQFGFQKGSRHLLRKPLIICWKGVARFRHSLDCWVIL